MCLQVPFDFIVLAFCCFAAGCCTLRQHFRFATEPTVEKRVPQANKQTDFHRTHLSHFHGQCCRAARPAHCALRTTRAERVSSPAALFEMQPADGTSVFLLLCFCQGNSNNCSIQLQLWQPNIQVFQLHSLVCRGHRK